MDLDKKDRLIIKALQQNARQSLSSLGKRIGLSQPAVSERVKRLEEAGVIGGYSARIDLRAMGFREDLERVVDALAAYGSVTTGLVLSHPVSKAIIYG